MNIKTIAFVTFMLALAACLGAAPIIVEWLFP